MNVRAFIFVSLPAALILIAMTILLPQYWGPNLQTVTIAIAIAAAMFLASLSFGRAARSILQRSDVFRTGFRQIARGALKDALTGLPVSIAICASELIAVGALNVSAVAIIIFALIGLLMLVIDWNFS